MNEVHGIEFQLLIEQCMGTKEILAAFILVLLFPAGIGFAQSDRDWVKSLQNDSVESIRYRAAGPRKTLITPSTTIVGYAIYYKNVQRKIEQFGTKNFPSVDGRHIYGKLTVRIPIFQDGSIFEAEGGPTVEKSSGDTQLDEYALGIVRKSAPFAALPQSLRSKDSDDLVVVIADFNFTRENVPVDVEKKSLNGR